MRTLTFTITFHGPFRVGGHGTASGIDEVIDRENPLPGTSIKGLLRAEAAELLGVPTPVVDAVFGSTGAGPSPWWWSDVQFPGNDDQCPGVVYSRVARIRVDDDTGTTSRGFLALGEQAWARTGTFTVEPTVGQNLAVEERSRHECVIRAAARSAVALGGARTRGSGWVTITEPGCEWTPADTATLLEVLGRG